MYQLIDGLAVYGDPVDANALAQIKRCVSSDEHAVKGVLCGDHHYGYSMPIGGVVAYEDAVSPSGVGFDIACGNRASKLDIPGKDVLARIKPIMDDVWATIDFGVGRQNKTTVDHELFDDPAWNHPAMKPNIDKARRQLGTIGSGNHYTDVFIDEDGFTWIGVHFGSRGPGHLAAKWFLDMGGADDKNMDSPPLVLSTDSALGYEYLQCMELAGRYAYAGRDWVCEKIASMLGATILETIHNHHNFCVASDQKIPTPTGPKLMKDIKNGDEVYTFDETKGLVKSKVTDHWQSGRKTTYNIQTRSRQLRVSGDHPLLIIRVESKPHPQRPWFNKREGTLTFVNAASLCKGDILVCASEYYNRDKSIGDDLARFIGAYLGDGWIRNNKTDISGYTVGLAIGGHGDIHTKKYLDLCTAVFPNVKWRNNLPGAFGLTCSSKNVQEVLFAMDVAYKSNQRYIPEFVYSLSLQEKLAFLSGYFDADGSLGIKNSKNHGRGSICAASKDLVEGLREIAISCGMQVTPVLPSYRDTNFALAVVYQCTISADGVSLLSLWHEDKVSSQRITKFQKAQGLALGKIGYVNLPHGVFGQYITKISTSIEKEDVYDMSVDHHSHSFVCEGVVVHNCWKERHGDRDLYVVRKGATPAFPGQKGFVGGSMGDNAVILEGVESEQSAAGLYSTVHGAGRVMSRTAAAGKKNWKTGERKTEGLISDRMMIDWVKHFGVELRGAGVDEAPQAYKRLPEVLTAHEGTIKILHQLKPIGVAMASADIRDPYRD